MRKIGIILSVGTVLRSYAAYTEPSAPDYIPKRQDTPNLVATSINWWPYPAYQSWGGATPTSVTDPATLTPITSFIAAVSISTGGTVNTITPPATTPSSTTATPNFTSSGSMIYITALPPASTPRRALKHPTKNSFNLAYLAPLFVVIGIVVGMLITWLIFFLSRGRWAPRRQVSSFKYGPEYVPPAERIRTPAGLPVTDDEESGGSRFLGMMRHGKQSLRESMFKGNNGRPGWLQYGRAAHQREAAATSPTSLCNQSTPGPAERSYRESDPFLSPTGRSVRQVQSPGLSPIGDTHSPATRSLQGTDVFSDDEDVSSPYDTACRKPIQRGILERLKTGSRHRRGHKKTDSDVQIEQLCAGGEYAPVTCMEELTPSRASTSSSGTTRGVPLPLVRSGTSGPGFMIVQDDPDSERPSPSQEGGMLGLNWTLPWIASPDKVNTDDKFTALPSRKSLAEKKTPCLFPGVSRATSSTSAKANSEQDLSRADSSVLPVSPPRVTSPPLEAQLFFGTIPEFGSAPQLAFDFPPPRPVVATSPLATSPPSKSRKLYTKRSPPLLPFPSSGSKSPYRQRLTKTPTKSASPARAHTSPAPPGKTLSSAVRYAERHDALNKVDEIIAKSWSTRDLRGEKRVSSPTMFGAVADSNTTAQGIEQRLFTQERPW